MHLPTCVQNLPVSLLWVRPVCQTALWVECKAVACFLSPPTLRICHVQRVKQPACWSIPVAQAQSLVCDAIVQNLNLSQVYNVQCLMFNVQCERVTQWVECAAGCIFSSELLYTSLPTVGATFAGGPSPLYTLVHFYLGLGSLCWFINAFGVEIKSHLLTPKILDAWHVHTIQQLITQHSIWLL